jgi:hypothetical protein
MELIAAIRKLINDGGTYTIMQIIRIASPPKASAILIELSLFDGGPDSSGNVVFIISF